MLVTSPFSNFIDLNIAFRSAVLSATGGIQVEEPKLRNGISFSDFFTITLLFLISYVHCISEDNIVFFPGVSIDFTSTSEDDANFFLAINVTRTVYNNINNLQCCSLSQLITYFRECSVNINILTLIWKIAFL
jgi:hypothetical protein